MWGKRSLHQSGCSECLWGAPSAPVSPLSPHVADWSPVSPATWQACQSHQADSQSEAHTHKYTNMQQTYTHIQPCNTHACTHTPTTHMHAHSHAHTHTQTHICVRTHPHTYTAVNHKKMLFVRHGWNGRRNTLGFKCVFSWRTWL